MSNPWETTSGQDYGQEPDYHNYGGQAPDYLTGATAAAEYGQVPVEHGYTFAASAAPPSKTDINLDNQEYFGDEKDFEGEFGQLNPTEPVVAAVEQCDEGSPEKPVAIESDVTPESKSPSNARRDRSESPEAVDSSPAEEVSEDKPSLEGDDSEEQDSSEGPSAEATEESTSRSNSASVEDEDESEEAEASDEVETEESGETTSESRDVSADTSESRDATSAVTSESDEVIIDAAKEIAEEVPDDDESSEVSASEEVELDDSKVPDIIDEEDEATEIITQLTTAAEQLAEISEIVRRPDIVGEEDEATEIIAQLDAVTEQLAEVSEIAEQLVSSDDVPPADVAADEQPDESEASIDEPALAKPLEADVEEEVESQEEQEEKEQEIELEQEDEDEVVPSASPSVEKAQGGTKDGILVEDISMRDLTVESTCDTPDQSGGNKRLSVDTEAPASISKPLPKKLSNVMQFAPLVTIEDDQTIGACKHAIDFLKANDSCRLTSCEMVTDAVTADTWKMFLEQRAGDARLVCKTSEGPGFVFSTHKTILAMRCPALLVKSQYSMRPVIMLQVLFYVYTDVLPTEQIMSKWDLEYLFAVLTASSDLDIDRFRRVVIQHLVGRLEKPFDCLAEIVTRALAEPRCGTVIYSVVRAMFENHEFFFDQDRLLNLAANLNGNAKAQGLVTYVSMAASNKSVDKDEFLAKYDSSDLTPLESTLLDDFKQLHEVSCPPDVCLKTSGRSFHVHSAILSARSSYFANVLPRGNDTKCPTQDLEGLTGGDLAQKNAKQEDEFPLFLEHKIFTQDATAIAGVLEFIYTGKFPALDLDSALNALKILGDWKQEYGSLGLKDCQVGRDMLYLQVKAQWLGEEMVQILNVFDLINIGDQEMDEGVSFCFKYFNVQCSEEIVSSLPHRPALKLLALFSSGSGRGLTPKKGDDSAASSKSGRPNKRKSFAQTVLAAIRLGGTRVPSDEEDQETEPASSKEGEPEPSKSVKKRRLLGIW